MSVNPRYRFTFNREKIGWAREVPIVVYAETEKEALSKVVTLTDEGGADWAYTLVSVEEVERYPVLRSVTHGEG